jgi:hypothetical protein
LNMSSNFAPSTLDQALFSMSEFLPLAVEDTGGLVAKWKYIYTTKLDRIAALSDSRFSLHHHDVVLFTSSRSSGCSCCGLL